MKRVLFVCIGNACRSQMAETFARALGGDVLEAESGGLYPLGTIPPETREVMREIGYEMKDQRSTGVDLARLGEFDYVINMSGLDWPFAPDERLRTWNVPDPYGDGMESHRDARDLVEHLVQQLIDEASKG